MLHGGNEEQEARGHASDGGVVDPFETGVVDDVLAGEPTDDLQQLHRGHHDLVAVEPAQRPVLSLEDLPVHLQGDPPNEDQVHHRVRHDHAQDADGKGEEEPVLRGHGAVDLGHARQHAVGDGANARRDAAARCGVGNRQQHTDGVPAQHRCVLGRGGLRLRGVQEASGEGRQHDGGRGVRAPHGHEVADASKRQHHDPGVLDADPEQEPERDAAVQVHVLDGDVDHEGADEEHLDPAPVRGRGGLGRHDIGERQQHHGQDGRHGQRKHLEYPEAADQA
mmetsp:Transcript_133316/g.414552  ORF Transcript_133316/g.414552 Transcript_133316/m.414552 type:complete len:279 (+) Transcript_133316:721-1557(+)